MTVVIRQIDIGKEKSNFRDLVTDGYNLENEH